MMFEGNMRETEALRAHAEIEKLFAALTTTREVSATDEVVVWQYFLTLGERKSLVVVVGIIIKNDEDEFRTTNLAREIPAEYYFVHTRNEVRICILPCRKDRCKAFSAFILNVNGFFVVAHNITSNHKLF